MKNKNEIEALQRQLEEEIKARKMAEDSLKKREKEISILKIEQTLLLEKLENSDAEYINQTTILENIIQETPYPVIWISPGDLQIIFTNESGNKFLNQLKRVPNAKKKWEKFVLNPFKNNTHTTLDLHLKETIYQIHGIYIPELNQKVIYAFDISRLKATQEALLKSETRYKIMVESVTDIIYRVTRDGFFTYVNPIAEKILGYSIEEFKKMHFSDLIREDYREEIVTYYINQGINDIPNSYKEFPVITKSGKEIWIGQNVTLVFENGLVSEVYALARDITSIKKTEEEIESSANRMKSLVENLEAGILMEDENRKIIHVNETFCKLLRIPVSPKELIGQDCTNFANLSKHLFADPDLFVSEIDQLIKNKKTKLGYEVKLFDNTILERDFIVVMSGNQYAGFLWQYRDITEKKNIQNTIIQSEEKYRSIIDNMYLGLIRVDLDDKIIEVNSSLCEMIGYEKHEIIGKNAKSILLAEGFEHKIDSVSDQRKVGKSSVYEIGIKRKDGKIIHVLISGAPEFNDKKEIIGSIGIHLDISDRIKLEEELRKARIKAEDSSKAKELFLANMSHEIRTPMNAILGMASLLKNSPLNANQSSYLNAIQDSAENLLVIINDILDFSKIEAGKLSLERIGFKVTTLLNQVLAQTQIKASEKGILIRKVIDPQVNDIFISDPTRLHQILLNLVSNSIKFTEIGSVTIRILVLEDYPDSQLLQFDVIDTGIGIEKEKLKNIFESFTQEDTSTTRKFGGSGLGLTISRQIVELFGGELKAESEKGKGSRFYFELKLHKGKESDVPVRDIQIPENNSLRGLKILVAEDNKINQFLTKTILENWGIEVTIVDDGIKAIHELKKNSFEIVLMDMQMPEMDGIEATKIIRNEIKSDIPIIALTANAVIGDKENCLNAGMNDYITKPFLPEILYKKLIQYSKDKKSRFSKNIKNEAKELYSMNNLNTLSSNDQEFIKMMIDLFIESGKETIQHLKIGIEKGDWNSINHYAHKFKPAIDTFEIYTLKDIIRKVEKYDPELNNPAELQQWIDQIENVLTEIIHHLQTKY